MTVFVDELIAWPGPRVGPFGGGRRSCHMSCDGDLAELHELARLIGLRREWFQPHRSMPHYDLTPRRREAALAAGAVFVSAREQARRRLAARKG